MIQMVSGGKYRDQGVKTTIQELKLKQVLLLITRQPNKAVNHQSHLSKIIFMSEQEGVKRLIATV
jgi:hypothetical protein